jgi:hypothetical protein
MSRMMACAYEDRPSAIVGLKLLLLSLRHHCPDMQVHVFHRLATDRLEGWVKRVAAVSLHSPPDGAAGGWDAKPALLLHLMEAGFTDILWLDSDLIFTADVRNRFGALTEDTLVATEERRDVTGNGSDARTRRLGLNVGRVFQRALCTCVLRVTSRHRSLLERWQESLERPDYRKSQNTPFDDRDWVLGGDQDMLSGLLGASEFAGLPVKQLRDGVDVAHCFLRSGYSVQDRLRNLRSGLPSLVHAQGPKPWELEGVLFAELSPYCAAARPYVDQLDEPAPWARPRRLTAQVLDKLAFGNPNLRDFPIAAWDQLRASLRRLMPTPAHPQAD